MAAPYPPIEPYDHGMLDTGDGNLVYWEACGNPDGKPALVVHGGPGSGCSTGPRKSFDRQRYRIILFDQRGCGRSTPHASDPATDMTLNTTENLIADMEQLREHLGVDRWLLFGGSWGSTLSLAYAERYPERVSEIVLVSVTSTRRYEIDWLYRGVGWFFPEAWKRFRDGVPEADRDGDLVGAYARLMENPYSNVRAKAAVDWCAWEDAVLSAEPNGKSNPYGDMPSAAMLAFVRICSHYFAHGGWLEEGQLIRNAGRLAGIPGILIHDRLDMSGPLDTAWELARAWPGAALVTIEDSGHKGSAAMSAAFGGGRVSFRGATFSGGRVSFFHAAFSGARVLFRSATFRAGMVSFEGAAFDCGTVGFEDAVINDSGVIDFGNAMFSGTAFTWGSVPAPPGA